MAKHKTLKTSVSDCHMYDFGGEKRGVDRNIMFSRISTASPTVSTFSQVSCYFEG